ncbi:TonB-dependent receptor [Larkinella terrae]|uniref:SusC/RagA family TonB-linked outer membrane protein n=1 Tax=Larkinella terrae TaxID=2025311 RepID=A0A7K0EEY4_9BACT|nr:TonB-dependent receptor [Larkinella terrae]MRS60384.1 SusC/RagA family TonB-linked outer membrane protein [Larkinella terrae]
MKRTLLNQIRQLVRLSALGILILLLPGSRIMAATSPYQSKSLEEIYLNLSLKNVRLEDALNIISERTQFSFAYNGETLDKNQLVTISDKNLSLASLLRILSKDANLQFLRVNSQIYVRKKKLFEASIIEKSLSDGPVTIQGTVKDQTGAVLPGANILIKGKTQGTVTDGDGKFQLQLEGGKGTLVVSSIGYVSEEVVVSGNRTVLAIVLNTDIKSLEEIVVVGYGEQKKVNLTGSVATVAADELVKRSTANVENLLQGKVTGLQVVQNSGQPGDDGAIMTIRGLGTFSDAGAAPLVLVDGVVGNLTNLNADNIESISVLKDAASASIYGARGANGVILVTTKKGKAGSFNVDYRADFQLHQPTRMPKLVTNSADFMTYFNAARARSGQAPLYTQTEIDTYRNATDRTKYPNFDWIDFIVGNASAQQHYLSVNGGSEKTTYNFSTGYLNQNGIAGGHSYKRYNFNLNVDSKVNRILRVGANIGLVKKDIMEPPYTDSDYMLLVYSMNPTNGPYVPDGSGHYSGAYRQGVPSNRNPLAVINSGSVRYEKYNLTAQSYVDINITPDLTWGVKGAVNYSDDFTKVHEHPVDAYYFSDGTYQNNGNPTRLGITDRFDQSILTTLYSTFNYKKTFGKDHFVTGLLGYNQESFKNRYLQGARQKFPTDDLMELNAGSTDNQSTAGTSYEWAIQSLFGRFTYDYKERYLLETNFRYDGTSRIQQDNRWGFFPSLSAGWRVSNEEFLKSQSWIDNLKLRASWGQLGNQNIGNYPYQDILSVTTYPFDVLQQGVVQTRLTDKNLRWETTTITDIGLDFSFKKRIFSGSIDWYNKITDGIIYAIEVPGSVGLTGPTVNYAKMQNQGIELNLSHSNKIGELRYDINANFSKNANKVLKVKAPFYDNNNTIQEGLPWMSNYLIEWAGIFQSQEEIDKGPAHPYNPKPGDLKFKDQNGDNKIDGNDRVVVPGAYPKFYYGGGVNAFWKNFDFSIFFQGVYGNNTYVDRWGIDPFTQGSAPTLEFAQNAWTPENKSTTHPAMYLNGYGPDNGLRSTYFLMDASYLRIKNLVLGYSFPKTITSKIRMKDLRIYLSSDNLATFTKYPGADPERTGTGRQRFATYPQVRMFTAGLKVKF